jgi:2-dehydropantoate 2-reductase
MGAGAVGCYFGGMLARAGAPVTLIGRQPHVAAIERDGLHLDSLHFRETIRVSASDNVNAASDAAIVLLCVKTLDTETAAQALVPHLAPDTIVASFQNGVDNVERIRTASGISALPTAVYVAAEMAAPGRAKHSGRGDLAIGKRAGGNRQELEEFAAIFARAGVPCRISDNIEADLWIKLLMNCAYNAISALGHARYGRAVEHRWTRAIMEQITNEVVTVGRAAGVRFPDVDLLDAVSKLGGAMPNALSSTAQDIARGKRTEIDSLNGYVARRGAELGIATPVNQTLHALVKLLEEAS